jgi:hypothetical protein
MMTQSGLFWLTYARSDHRLLPIQMISPVPLMTEVDFWHHILLVLIEESWIFSLVGRSYCMARSIDTIFFHVRNFLRRSELSLTILQILHLLVLM